MMSLTFGLFTQVSGSGPLGLLLCVNKLYEAIHSVRLNYYFKCDVYQPYSARDTGQYH